MSLLVRVSWWLFIYVLEGNRDVATAYDVLCCCMRENVIDDGGLSYGVY